MVTKRAPRQAAPATGSFFDSDRLLQEMLARGLVYYFFEEAAGQATADEQFMPVKLGDDRTVYILVKDAAQAQSLAAVMGLQPTQPVFNAKRNEITRSLGSLVVYKSGVEINERACKPLEIAWKGRGSGMTAYKYFQDHFADTPFEERPTSDEIRQASRRFYDTLVQHQSYHGQSIHDLFPADPNARGGSKTKCGGELTIEQLVERVQRKRERDRITKAQRRAQKKASPLDPK